MNIITIIISLFLILAVPVSAAKNENLNNSQLSQQKIGIVTSPTGSTVQNKNQVKTQNQGEEVQIQIQNQEEENERVGTGSGSQNRNQTAIQNMSEVAKQVQQLLQIRTEGGIGDQVREIAKAQNQAQVQIQDQINKLDKKSKLSRFLTGTDYGAVKNLKQQIQQNQVRIRQLEQLKTQISNEGDVAMIQETIQALIQENTSLQERVRVEENTKSLFGWLVKLFNK